MLDIVPISIFHDNANHQHQGCASAHQKHKVRKTMDNPDVRRHIPESVGYQVQTTDQDIALGVALLRVWKVKALVLRRCQIPQVTMRQQPFFLTQPLELSCKKITFVNEAPSEVPNETERLHGKCPTMLNGRRCICCLSIRW